MEPAVTPRWSANCLRSVKPRARRTSRKRFANSVLGSAPRRAQKLLQNQYNY